MTEYKDKFYIFESTTEKSVSSFFGSNSKYIKLKHTFDAKTYKLLKKDEKAFSDMKYYVYIYQDGKYAYFGNYGGKINIKRYDLETGKIVDINLEKIYPYLEKGYINYEYITDENNNLLINIILSDKNILLYGRIKGNEFKVKWIKEIKEGGKIKIPFKKNISLTCDKKIDLKYGLLSIKKNIYIVSMDTGEIIYKTDKPYVFYKVDDKYYGIIKLTEKKEDKIDTKIEIYEMKVKK